jgi:hypothetical protein
MVQERYHLVKYSHIQFKEIISSDEDESELLLKRGGIMLKKWAADKATKEKETATNASTVRRAVRAKRRLAEKE